MIIISPLFLGPVIQNIVFKKFIILLIIIRVLSKTKKKIQPKHLIEAGLKCPTLIRKVEITF